MIIVSVVAQCLLLVYIIFAVRILCVSHGELGAGPQRADKNFAEQKWQSIVQLRASQPRHQILMTTFSGIEYLIISIYRPNILNYIPQIELILGIKYPIPLMLIEYSN